MKIVVGFVASDEGRAALEWAVQEAKRQDDEIIVVHSIRGGGSVDAEEEEVLTYRKELDAVERQLSDMGVRYATRRLIRGWSPAEDLIKVVAEEEADMIVIGIRRRSRTGKLLMGSNAQEILLNSECPVMAVKASYRPSTS